MKKLLFLIAFLLFSLGTKAQTCYYCSEEELVQLFKDKKLYYKTGYTDSGTKYYYINKGFYKQVYYLYYNINTIYVIVTENKDYATEVSKGLDEVYNRETSVKWSSEDFNIMLDYENNTYSFIFEYR